MHCCRLCFNVGFILALVCAGRAHSGSKVGASDDDDSDSLKHRPSHVANDAQITDGKNRSDVSAKGKLIHFEQKSFLKYIFEKYGDESGKMTFEGFEHLLESLGLGEVVIMDHDVRDHKMFNGSFAELHADNHTEKEPASPDVTFDGNQQHDENDSSSERNYVVVGADGRPVHDHDEHYSYSTIDHDHERIHHVHHHRKPVGKRVGHVSHNHTTSDDLKDDVNDDSILKNAGESQKNVSQINERHLDVPTDHRCLSAGEIYHVFGLSPGTDSIGADKFVEICPALLYELELRRCRRGTAAGLTDNSNVFADGEPDENNYQKIWLYATLSVVVISMCGLGGVAVVPFIGRHFYGAMLQFLIALAIGTLTGDAFLHLLPQALAPVGHLPATVDSVTRRRRQVLEDDLEYFSDADGHGHGHSHDKDQIWHMLTALGAMLFFFIVENTLPSFMAWRERRHEHKHDHEKDADAAKLKRKRCDLKGHGLASGDQYRYDNQMVTHYIGDKLCREEGQCEIVACDNIPCSDESCPQDSCVIVTEGACGGGRPDHCHASNSNNNDGLMSCLQETDSRRCSGKWSEPDHCASHDHPIAAVPCKRYSLCSTGNPNKDSSDGGVGPSLQMCALNSNGCSAGSVSKGGAGDRASTPCSFGKPTGSGTGAGGDGESSKVVVSRHERAEDMEGGSGGKDDDDNEDAGSDDGSSSGEEADEKEALKKGKGMHHHHRHHHHHHHHIKPDSASAVAWMVIAGDGLHNLTDGFAIGAAFAVSIWGGVSTTVAVFCHELPHEVGDFAMLLATGMGVKEALLYNILSSILCFAGMAGGILIVTGNGDQGGPMLSPWVFAATAGIFLYLALVDMIPELTNSDRGPKSALVRVSLQVAGMVTGFAIMFLIAYYEETLHTMLQS